MSFKIPCGGFRLDEKSFSLDENGVLSIPKPLTYDYMPEGYPKNDGWVIEWDGNTEGKTYIEIKNIGMYKISGMVLTDDDLLSATYEYLDYPGKTFNIPADGLHQLSDSSTMVNGGGFGFITVRKDNADLAGLIIPEKGVYASADSKRFKMTKKTITPMSTDFMPKNFNVVFSGINKATPDSCNVTYDELRGWIENGTPVFAIYKTEGNDGSVSNVRNIVNFEINTDSLSVYYQTGYSTIDFVYKSDGTFSKNSS